MSTTFTDGSAAISAPSARSPCVEGEEDHVHSGGGGRGEVLEDEGGAPLERRMGRSERLAHEVDGGDAAELDVGVEKEPADHLGAAVAGAPITAAGSACVCHDETIYPPGVLARGPWSRRSGSLAREAVSWLSARRPEMEALLRHLVGQNSFTQRAGGERGGLGGGG